MKAPIPLPYSQAKVLARVLAFLAWVSLAACTTAETDPSNRYTPGLNHSRIDFRPPRKEDFENQVKLEDQLYAEQKKKLDDAFAVLKAQHEDTYQSIVDKIPNCRTEAFCRDGLVKGNVKLFERYRALVAPLNEIDKQAALVDFQRGALDHRHDLRTRALYNRYLVTEILAAHGLNTRIRAVLVHALEAYPTRRSLSERLLRISDPGVVPTLYGDLNFQMMGKPVDEASVLATFDVEIAPSRKDPDPQVRYLITYLVNTHHKNAAAFDQKFRQTLADQWAEPFQNQLREAVFCGLYSIAGDTLVDKLALAKVKACSAERARQQDVAEAAQEKDGEDSKAPNLNPADAILPVAFVVVSRGAPK